MEKVLHQPTQPLEELYITLQQRSIEKYKLKQQLMGDEGKKRDIIYPMYRVS